MVAVLAPFTRRDDRPAQVTTAPAGWREIDVPDKDLVPAAAALLSTGVALAPLLDRFPSSELDS